MAESHRIQRAPFFFASAADGLKKFSVKREAPRSARLMPSQRAWEAKEHGTFAAAIICASVHTPNLFGAGRVSATANVSAVCGVAQLTGAEDSTAAAADLLL